ncbi:hypothetical protein MMC32_006795 [Xylographa parallela]|nr:hypothetical protein [Xylographa parallela]
MNPAEAISRVLLPRPAPSQTGLLPPNVQLPSSHAGPTTDTRPRSRQPKTTTRSEQDWEDQRPNITRLFVEQDLPLQDVIQMMDEQYHFKASRKQYNTKIQQWHIGKNVRDIEMRAIVRKEMQRKMENPAKNSVFRVRKRPVNSQKIERFMRDKGFEGDDVIIMDAGTPSDISCDTPRPESCALSIQDLQTIPEDDISRPLDSTAQPMSPLDSYLSALSPRFNLLLNSPDRCHKALNQPFATNNPDLSQLQQEPDVEHNSSLPAPFHRTLDSPFNFSNHRYHSSLSLTLWTSPHIIPHASIGRRFNPLAWVLVYTAEPDFSRFDWFESFDSPSNSARLPPSMSFDIYLGGILYIFIRIPDNFEDWKGQRRSWYLMTQNTTFDRTAPNHSPVFRSSNALNPKFFEIFSHLCQNLCQNPPTVFPATLYLKSRDSETLEVMLPVELNPITVLCTALAVGRAAYLAKYQDAQRGTQAWFLEIRDILQEIDLLLKFANEDTKAETLWMGSFYLSRWI